MKLQTTIPLQSYPFTIGYQDQMLLMGSCFVTHMAQKLSYFKFRNTVNPFGVIFQPCAIEKLLVKAINKDWFTNKDVFFYNEQWHCFSVHSQCSNTDKEALLADLNSNLELLHTSLVSCSYFVLTLGTAWAYRYIETDELVANCHKVPQRKFLKELLSVEEVTASVENTLVLIKSVNPNVKVIATVSPVRHLKDGFVENMRSKAHLVAGLQNVIEPRNKVFYFPSYEIMMDELRDYRFYKEDMVHPTDVAVQYIWEKFSEVWVGKECADTMKLVDTVQKGLQHRPFNPNTEAHKKFVEGLEKKIEMLKRDFSFINF